MPVVRVLLFWKSCIKPFTYLFLLLQYLKIIRHPGIVKFLAAGQKGSSYILLTESVRPLEKVLSTLSSTEVCAGLFNIIEAMVFLHDKVGNNNLYVLLVLFDIYHSCCICSSYFCHQYLQKFCIIASSSILLTIL